MASAPGRQSLTLGTMRLLEVDKTRDEWLAFLASVHDIGIRTLHSSIEYESFALLTSLLSDSAFRQDHRPFRHIVKLAEPSFDDDGFSAVRLEQKVRAYCEALSSPVISDIQWMWRRDLKDDAARIAAFVAAIKAISSTVFQLKHDGLIERFFCFPYSVAFARVALEQDTIDGLVVYRNMLERDYDELIDLSAKLGKQCHIIRPFNAGGVLIDSNLSPSEHLKFAFDMPAIESAIVSSNNLNHLTEIASSVGERA
jgi:hypothetical protein